MQPSSAVEALIRDEAAKLETYCGDIIKCRVVVEIPNKHHLKGDLYHVLIDLVVPGNELVAEHNPGQHNSMQNVGTEMMARRREIHLPRKDIYASVRNTFDDARRRIQDYVRKRRDGGKTFKPLPLLVNDKL